MKLRLTSHIVVMMFLGVMVTPLLSSYHNPHARHIDQAQVQHLESHTQKVKNLIQHPGLLSPPAKVILRTFSFNISDYVYPLQDCSSGVIVSCRAPPA
jgi:hypothetical protein